MSSERSNGETQMVPDNLSDSDKIELILNALGELQEQTELLSSKFDELIEQLANRTLPGGDFDIDFLDRDDN